MTSWGELVRSDKGLRAFIDAEIARAGIEVAALRIEAERDAACIAALRREVAELRAELGKKKGK